MEIEKLIIWVVITLVPLIPTFVTHRFLESNATYKSVSSGVKLGGGIAAYFVLVTLAFTSWNSLFTDPLSSVRAKLEGEWKCTGTITQSNETDDVNKTVESSMTIGKNGGGKISLQGQVDGTGVFWKANEAIVTHKELIYIFNVPISGTTGITWLNFQPDTNTNEINMMFGHWVVTGSTGKGSLTCYRNVPPVNKGDWAAGWDKFFSYFDLKTY